MLKSSFAMRRWLRLEHHFEIEPTPISNENQVAQREKGPRQSLKAFGVEIAVLVQNFPILELLPETKTREHTLRICRTFVLKASERRKPVQTLHENFPFS